MGVARERMASSSNSSNAHTGRNESLKLLMDSKRPGNYRTAMRKQSHQSSMSNIAF
jgi:hypothetical protein